MKRFEFTTAQGSSARWHSRGTGLAGSKDEPAGLDTYIIVSFNDVITHLESSIQSIQSPAQASEVSNG